MDRVVELPTGNPLTVASEEEEDFVTDLVARYSEQLAFTTIADLTDLDRLIELELISKRWNQSLLNTSERQMVDQLALGDKAYKVSAEIRQLKKLLGIDRTTREKSRGDGTVPQWMSRILTAAKAFGVHREQQLDKALELANQLIALWTVRENSSPDELRSLHLTDEDIFDWIRDVFIPEFQAVDAHFMEHDQRYWVRQL